MKRIGKGISLILCAMMVAAVVPYVQASDSLKQGDTVYFGKYFSNVDRDAAAPNAEFMELEVPDFYLSDDSPKLMIATEDGQYFARKMKRGTIAYYSNSPISWKVLHIENNKAVLITDHLVQKTCMHCNEQDLVNWENASIRSFLNGYDAAKKCSAHRFQGIQFYEHCV